jgi:hypothetical protein
MSRRATPPARRPAAKQLEIPAERPVASGELVDIRDLDDYRRKHGLRKVRNWWPATSRYPLAEVEDDPDKGKDNEKP